MAEGKEDKMRGGGCFEKNVKGGYAGEGKEDKMCVLGGVAKKN